jgi:hypothetical protein
MPRSDRPGIAYDQPPVLYAIPSLRIACVDAVVPVVRASHRRYSFSTMTSRRIFSQLPSTEYEYGLNYGRVQ